MTSAEVTHEYFGKKKSELANKISTIVLLVSFSMLFATLMLGYAAYRLTSDVWPPMGLDKIDLLFPSLSTFIIALSSYCLWQFSVSRRQKSERIAKQWLYSTLFMGAGFFIVQCILWSSLKNAGILANEGIFQSIVYGFTWVHAAHVVVAWLALIALFPTINNYKQKYENRVHMITNFWHFLGVIWLVMFVTIFIL